MSAITEIRRENLTPRVPPFKVIRGHWHRDGSIGYLLDTLIEHCKIRLKYVAVKLLVCFSGSRFGGVLSVLAFFYNHSEVHRQTDCRCNTPATSLKRILCVLSRTRLD